MRNLVAKIALVMENVLMVTAIVTQAFQVSTVTLNLVQVIVLGMEFVIMEIVHAA